MLPATLVQAGDYRVSAEAQGVKAAVADSVNVTVNARQRVETNNFSAEFGRAGGVGIPA